jgi:N-acyl-D-amino-acid deacylase
MRWSPFLVALLASAAAAVQQPPSTLIRNALVVDGSGTPGRRVDVRIDGSTIAEVGRLPTRPGEQVIDAGGFVLAPGFVDTHSHHLGGMLDRPDALGVVSQGVTTIVAGQDGSSAYPLVSTFDRLTSSPVAVNVASYVGHGTLRSEVMGKEYRRPATAAEIARMRELLRVEMAAGALGLSTGLEYDPGIYSKTEEIAALAREVAAVGGRYASHIRSEDRDFWPAVEEVVAIGRDAGIPVHISHLKLAMRSLWGQGDKLLGLLDRARAEGLELTADIYPYTYWHSDATVLFPKRNYDDRAEAALVLEEIVAPDDLLFGSFPPDPAYAGKTLAQIAALRGTDPPATLLTLIKETEAMQASASIVATSMDERDVARLMQWRFTNLCSDGSLTGTHPRGFGSFPRVLGRYVRERRVLTLEEAIHKMTALAAASAGISDRGRIAPGQAADLVLFDPETVVDRATTSAPQTLSVGIRSVWVNGVPVFEEGAATGRRPGRVLRRTAR